MSFENRKWIDNSKANAFERCPREFLLRYHLDLAQPNQDTLILDYGKAFHSGVECFFKAVFQDGLAESQALEMATEVAVRQLNEALQRLAELGAESLYTDPRANPDLLVRALTYFLTSGAGRDIKVMSQQVLAELKLAANLAEPDWQALGRIDLLIQSHTGDWIVIDVKTTRWSIRDWNRKALVDTQLSTYGWIAVATATAPAVTAGAYAVCRADQRLLKSGAWSPSISLDSELVPVALTVSRLQATEARFNRIASRLSSLGVGISDTHEIPVREFPCHWSACQRLGGICQFAQLCELTWDVGNTADILETAERLGYEAQPWHPFDDQQS